ncbi:unnamed protein product [Haemonchus placei]|uniref:RICTOR_N domain-containing protein n=1 Tax=Haemonchus placei TaxID=6290 RepID=A0A0N4WQX0_HAEPC|nr:unnamed protein product [Haemonchus placei]
MYVSPYRDKSDVINLIRQSSGTPLSDDYETKRLFLNQLLSYILETRQESLNDATLFEELCLLLVRILRDNHACIRAMCFRLLRLCLFTERNLVCILTSQADVYTVRALDLQVENDEEREEALQLIFKMMVIYQQSHLKRLIEFSAAQQEGKKYAFPKSIMQPVIALALHTVCPRKGKDSTNPYEKTCGGENATDGLYFLPELIIACAVDLEKLIWPYLTCTTFCDPCPELTILLSNYWMESNLNSWFRLSMACFEVFLEFCVLEPDLILKMAGTDWMVRILTGDSTISQRVAAVVARILVAWLDQPTLRAKGKLHLVLEQIFAPLIEFGFFQKNLASTEQGERIVDSAMHNFSISFLCILRTWSGLLSCAAIGPNSKLISSSPFRLLEYLGLGTVEDNNLQIFAPLIEFGFFQKNLASTEQGERIVDSAMHNFSISFLCILRTWSGLLSCAAVGPNSKLISSSPFRLLEYLGLGTVEDNNLVRIREMIVDICCDFLNLPYASMKFEDWDHALEYYSSITVPDEFSYSLKDDFVLAQSEMCIAMDEELARHVDLLRCFRSLAGFILINAGLLQSLARLIVAQPDSSSGLKATLFVTDVVRTASAVMPSGWRATLLSMPTLVQSACETLAQSMAAAAIHGYYDPNQTDRFTFPHSWNAAMLLNRFDTLNKAWIGNSLSGPAVDSHYSLFLCPPKALSLPEKLIADESSLQPLIDEMLSGDDNGINWEAAAILLAHISDGNRDLRMEAIWGVLDKMMMALWPRNGAHKRWKQCRFPIVVARNAITLGLELANEDERFLQIFTRYATECCSALSERKSSTDLFSVKNLVDSGSMFYFCLIGTMSAHPNGVMALEKSGILQT